MELPLGASPARCSSSSRITITMLRCRVLMPLAMRQQVSTITIIIECEKHTSLPLLRVPDADDPCPLVTHCTRQQLPTYLATYIYTYHHYTYTYLHVCNKCITMFIVNMYNKRNTNREHSVLPKKTKCYYNLSMLIKLSRGLLRSSLDDDTCVEIAIPFYPHFGLRNDF